MILNHIVVEVIAGWLSGRDLMAVMATCRGWREMVLCAIERPTPLGKVLRARLAAAYFDLARRNPAVTLILELNYDEARVRPSVEVLFADGDIGRLVSGEGNLLLRHDWADLQPGSGFYPRRLLRKRIHTLSLVSRGVIVLENRKRRTPRPLGVNPHWFTAAKRAEHRGFRAGKRSTARFRLRIDCI